MDGLIDALLHWIGENSAYETTAMPPPAVIELSAEELTREYYTGVAHLIPDDGVDERLNALYAATDGDHGTIYILSSALVEDADHFDHPHENPLWREILLHELVHHAQWQSGDAETWLCPAQGERLAYHLGGTYLKEHRVDDPIPNRNFWAQVYSRC